jgi:hypothetical protein
MNTKSSTGILLSTLLVISLLAVLSIHAAAAPIILGVPGKPVLVSPENGYSTTDNTPTFTWT